MPPSVAMDPLILWPPPAAAIDPLINYLFLNTIPGIIFLSIGHDK